MECSDPVFNGVRVIWVSRDLIMGTFLFSRAVGYFGSSLEAVTGSSLMSQANRIGSDRS